jgi:signal transduction histidine kinase
VRALRRLRRPLTARARLTAVYGVALAVLGLAMLAVSHTVLHARLTSTTDPVRMPLTLVSGAVPGGEGTTALGVTVPAGARLITTDNLVTSDGRTVGAVLGAYRREVWTTAERQLLLQSGVALAALVALAVVSGYLLAGRMLRPVHEVSVLARDIEAHDLHRRIPHRARGREGDELSDLVGVVNGMLDRLERTFEAQRRFLANAGHELRTPVAVQRTMLEVAAHPDADPAVRDLAGRVLPVLERQQRTVNGLLALARTRSRAPQPVPVDVAALVRAELAAHADDAARRHLRVTVDPPTDPAAVDVELLELVVANLVSNAVRHTPVGGRVAVHGTATADGEIVLVVENEGEVLTEEELAALGEPFRRGGTARTTTRAKDGSRSTGSAGAGLGLAVARDAAEAAGAGLELTPRPDGGVTARLTLPAADR